MFWVSRYPGGKDQSAWEDALQSQAVSIEKPEAEGRARECGISQAKWLEDYFCLQTTLSLRSTKQGSTEPGLYIYMYS